MPITTLLPTVTAQFLRALRAQALLTRVVNRDIDPAPAQRGDTLNLRLPVSVAPAAVTAGAAPVAPQAATTTPITLTLDRWFERSMGLTDKEVGEIEGGNMPQQVGQMAVDLVEYINADGYSIMKDRAGMAFNGTVTNLPYATDDAFFRNSLAQLDIARAPRSGRFAIHNPSAYWGGLALANIAQADRRGDAVNPLVSGDAGSFLGVPFLGDQLIPTQTTTAVGAGAMTVNGAFAAGITAISIAKAAGANYVAAAGDVISIAGHARNYVISAAATVVQGTNSAVTINGGLERAVVGGEVITLVGTAATYANSFMFHRDAVMFASRPLQDMEGVGDTYSLSDPATGLTIRGELVRQHKQVRLSFDCLWGWQVIRPLHVARILG